MNVRRTGVLLSSLALVLVSASASLAKEKEAPGERPGNNGIIKVVAGDPSEPDPGNEPHIDGCLLWLEFYGFEQGQTADITFRAHPPTGDGELLTHMGAPISADPAGGGQDKDAVLGYNLASALSQYEPQPQRGYRVKVTSESKEAPAGPRHKVFWVNCTPVPAGAMTLSKTVENGTGGPFKFLLACNHSPFDQEISIEADQSTAVLDIPGGTTCVVEETEKGPAASNRIAETPPDDAPDGKVVVPGGGNVTVAVTNVFGSGQPAGTSKDAGAGEAGQAELAGIRQTRTPAGGPASEPAAEVAGVSGVADATTLPRTGASPPPLLGAAAVLLAAGTVLLTGSCRRRASR